MWAFSAYDLVRGYPKSISSFGLPKTVRKVDAALYDDNSAKTLFFVGNSYYRCVQTRLEMKMNSETWLLCVRYCKRWIGLIACFSSVMMRLQRPWMRDSPKGWMKNSLAWLARWQQLCSTEVSSIRQYSDAWRTKWLPLFWVIQVFLQHWHEAFLSCRFCLPLQRTRDVWVQSDEREDATCAEKQLLPALL